MKNFFHILLLTPILLYSNGLISQGHYLLDNFSVSESNGNVSIRLTMSAGSTCNGIKFYRSEDSINFDEIGVIEGVCGLSFSPTNYQFIDNNPLFNKKIYYKVAIGIYGFSDILSIELIDNKVQNVQVRPNPVKDKALVYFSNPFSEIHSLHLYSNTGELIEVIETQENYFELDFSGKKVGMYFITITRQGHLPGYRGRVIVE